MTSEKNSAGPTCLAASMRTRRRSGYSAIAVIGKVPVSVLDHHNGGIDQHANRQRQATKRHDVRTHVQVVHRNEGNHNSDGKRDDGNQRRAKVEEENDNDEADDGGFLDKVALQRLD